MESKNKMYISRIDPNYLMQYQNKQKEKQKYHSAHDGGRFDKIFEEKLEENKEGKNPL